MEEIDAMDLIKIILLCTCITVILANVFVCYRVAVSDSFERQQKIIQCVLIWILPVLGAVVAYVFTREPKMTARGYAQNGSSYGIGDVGDGNGDGDYFGGGHH